MVVGRPSEVYEVLIPASTGVAARILGVSEPRLNDLIRRGKVQPPPHVIGGRRLWTRPTLLAAAEALGLPPSVVESVSTTPEREDGR